MKKPLPWVILGVALIAGIVVAVVLISDDNDNESTTSIASQVTAAATQPQAVTTTVTTVKTKTRTETQTAAPTTTTVEVNVTQTTTNSAQTNADVAQIQKALDDAGIDGSSVEKVKLQGNEAKAQLQNGREVALQKVDGNWKAELNRPRKRGTTTDSSG